MRFVLQNNSFVNSTSNDTPHYVALCIVSTYKISIVNMPNTL